MKSNELRRLSRRDLLCEAKAKGLYAPGDATRDELIELLADTENRQNWRYGKNRWWTSERVAVMQAHPDWTAALIADDLGTTTGAVEYARKRYGRFAPHDTSMLCVSCDERPVFVESREAKRLRLCKGCFLQETAKRNEERREHDRLRQAKHRAK